MDQSKPYTIQDLTKEDREKLHAEVVQVYLGQQGQIPSDEKINTVIAVICCLTGSNPFFDPLEPIKAKLINKLGRMPTLAELSAAVREATSVRPILTPRGLIEEVWKFVEAAPQGKICGIPYPVPSAREEL